MDPPPAATRPEQSIVVPVGARCKFLLSFAAMSVARIAYFPLNGDGVFHLPAMSGEHGLKKHV
jgi:hypothetical protein